METFIELKEMKFYAYHGVSQQEKDVGNYFTVDLRITAPLGKALHISCLEIIQHFVYFSLLHL